MRPVEEILAGLPARISHPVTRRWAVETPDAPALGDGERNWSYAEFARAVEAARDRLAALGVRPGDRVMIVNENGLALAALVMAASELDAWAAIVNARLSASEIDAIRDHCGARRVLYAVAVSAQAAAHARRHGAAVEEMGMLGPVGVGPLDERAEPEPVSADPAQQVAALIYTSGTTGSPKGVMLTHRNLTFVATVSGSLRALRPADRVAGLLPISHVFGFASVFLGTMIAGAFLRAMPRFDPGAVLRAFAEEGLTVFQGVPAMYAKLLEHMRAAGDRRPTWSLRYLSCGGAPLDQALKDEVEAAFGLTLNNGYGLSESGPTVSQTRIDAPPERGCSNGPLLPGVEAKLVDPRTRVPVPPGAVGELWVRGPGTMKGYYKAPEETAAVIDGEGWLNTRDLARFDENGGLWIVGRTRELIIRSGFNVYPPEVEATLNAYPGVTQSAVVGRKATDGNEEVVAFVQAAPGVPIDTAALAAFAAERLAPYKRPGEIVLLDALPASSTGKILKHKLAEMAAAGGKPAGRSRADGTDAPSGGIP
jgi:acyl-CoA synthetase (AMP-forming)/AMP-acid ligase II